jgi:GMP synthase (glutamine-hydrolysing)
VDAFWKSALGRVSRLVVLGRPVGANDAALNPVLAEEVDLSGQRIECGWPLQGICVGVPLMDRARGAAAEPMGRR